MTTVIYNDTNGTNTEQIVTDNSIDVDAIIALCMASVIISGNTLTILSVIIYRSLRENCHIFIASLAVSDLVAGLQFIPAGIILPHEPLRRKLLSRYPACFSSYSVILFACLSSIFNLVILTIDRYLIIVDPFKYGERMTRKRCILCITLAWSLATAIILLPAITSGFPNTTVSDCQICTIYSWPHSAFLFLVGFAIPLLGMVGMYCKIAVIALKKRRSVQPSAPVGVRQTDITVMQTDEVTPCENGNANLSEESCNKNASQCQVLNTERGNIADALKALNALNELAFPREGVEDLTSPIEMPYPPRIALQPAVLQPQISIQSTAGGHSLAEAGGGDVPTSSTTSTHTKLAKTLVIVLGCFTVCWLPYFFMFVSEAIKCGSSMGPLESIGYVMAVANSMMNPIIYAFRSPDFRKAYKKLLKCRYS